MSPEDDVRAASLVDAARALLSVLTSEGIDIPETRALVRAIAEAEKLEFSSDVLHMTNDWSSYNFRPLFFPPGFGPR